MVKIKDVAAAAGVSTATVSKILSNPEWGKSETREKVIKAVKQLQYQPNALARQLRTQETHTIIAIVPDLQNDIFHKMIYGIEKEAEKNGYHVLVADAHGQPSIETYYLNAIQQRQVDGIISMSAIAAQHIMQKVAAHYPLVLLVQNFKDSNIPSVGIDNFAASASMTKHMLHLGHKHIAYISSSADLLLYKDRLDGYLSVLRDENLPLDEELIRYGQSSMEGGMEQMDSLLAAGKKFTAVIAAGDTMAIGAITSLRKHGYNVPQDIAVTGFDDLDISTYYNPPLTTIRQPAGLLGEYAFRKLLQIIKKQNQPISSELLPYELIIRESCGHLL